MSSVGTKIGIVMAAEPASSTSKSLECPICFDQFAGDVKGASADLQPRILRCGHTFCTGCLKRIVPRQGSIRCPKCHQLTPFSKIDDVTINFQLRDVLEEQLRPVGSADGLTPQQAILAITPRSDKQCENCGTSTS